MILWKTKIIAASSPKIAVRTTSPEGQRLGRNPLTMGTHPRGVRESDAEEGQGNPEGRSSILDEKAQARIHLP